MVAERSRELPGSEDAELSVAGLCSRTLKTLTVLYHGLKRQAAWTSDELRKFQPHLNHLWRIRWAALLTTRLSPIRRSTLECSAGGQYSTSVATKIEHSRVRVLWTSVFAVMLASGAYAQQHRCLRDTIRSVSAAR